MTDSPSRAASEIPFQPRVNTTPLPIDLVTLDADHPGFRDALYRERRNTIARLAFDYREPNPVPDAPYVEEEHAVWRAVWQRLEPLHAQYACAAYVDSAKKLDLDHTRIPQLAAVNVSLGNATGFRMLPVAGLVSARTFLSKLADRIFLSTQYIRHHSVPLYTPEPDVVHELTGHAASLIHPEYVELNLAFGEAAKRASDDKLLALERAYWYTLEFGLVMEDNMVKSYGAGMLSSFGELERVAANEATMAPLNFDVIANTPYDPTHYQPTLFVAESWQAMLQMTRTWLRSI